MTPSQNGRAAPPGLPGVKQALGLALLCAGAALILGCRRQSSAATSPKPGCVTSLAADTSYGCALLEGGRLACWGRDVPTLAGFHAKPTPVSAFPAPSRSLFLGADTLCATTSDAKLRCAGSSSFRELGLPAIEKPSTAVVEHTLRDVRQVTWQGRCALTGSGLLCWEAGDVSAKPVNGLPARVKHVTGGLDFSCLLLENAEVWCRGTNLRGQLGVVFDEPEGVAPEARSLYRTEFGRVSSLGADTRALASSPRHSCALRSDASVWCWGENERGQIGKGDVSRCRAESGRFVCDPQDGLVPSEVKGLPRSIIALSLGETTSCAIEKTGGVWCWGSLPAPTPTPLRLALPEPAQALVVGGASVCALFQSGAVRCRGYDGDLSDWNNAVEMPFDCR